MQPEFDSTDFIKRLGHSLVKDIEEARYATTGSLIGAAIELPVRNRLAQVLPRGIAVGTGCVIDSYGNSSKQQDVILYERDVCPKFVINETSEAAYYPCEGVIAVIEVKSNVTSAELRDSFEKVESVRRLRRYEEYDSWESGRLDSQRVYRRYATTRMSSIIEFGDPQQEHELGYDQIFCFILGDRLKLKLDSFLEKFEALAQEFGRDYTPNLVEILEGKTLIPCVLDGAEVVMHISAKPATRFFCVNSDPFRTLIHWIYLAHRRGVTSPTEAFDRYIIGDSLEFEGVLSPQLPQPPLLPARNTDT